MVCILVWVWFVLVIVDCVCFLLCCLGVLFVLVFWVLGGVCGIVRWFSDLAYVYWLVVYCCVVAAVYLRLLIWFGVLCLLVVLCFMVVLVLYCDCYCDYLVGWWVYG